MISFIYIVKIIMKYVFDFSKNTRSHYYYIRWTEKWLRRWRGIFCGHSTHISPGGISQITGICRNAVRDLRSAYCANDGYSTPQNPETVLHAIRERLDCDIAYNNAPVTFMIVETYIKILPIVLLLLYAS